MLISSTEITQLNLDKRTGIELKQPYGKMNIAGLLAGLDFVSEPVKPFFTLVNCGELPICCQYDQSIPPHI